MDKGANNTGSPTAPPNTTPVVVNDPVTSSSNNTSQTVVLSFLEKYYQLDSYFVNEYLTELPDTTRSTFVALIIKLSNSYKGLLQHDTTLFELQKKIDVQSDLNRKINYKESFANIQKKWQQASVEVAQLEVDLKQQHYVLFSSSPDISILDNLRMTPSSSKSNVPVTDDEPTISEQLGVDEATVNLFTTLLGQLMINTSLEHYFDNFPSNVVNTTDRTEYFKKYVVYTLSEYASTIDAAKGVNKFMEIWEEGDYFKMSEWLIEYNIIEYQAATDWYDNLNIT